MMWLFADIYTGVPSSLLKGGFVIIIDLSFTVDSSFVYKSGSKNITKNITINLPLSTYGVVELITYLFQSAIFVILTVVLCGFLSYIFYYLRDPIEPRILIKRITFLHFLSFLDVLLILLGLLISIIVLGIFTSKVTWHILITFPISRALF